MEKGLYIWYWYCNSCYDVVVSTIIQETWNVYEGYWCWNISLSIGKDLKFDLRGESFTIYVLIGYVTNATSCFVWVCFLLTCIMHYHKECVWFFREFFELYVVMQWWRIKCIQLVVCFWCNIPWSSCLRVMTSI